MVSKNKFYKTTFKVTVLSEEPYSKESYDDNDPFGLLRIAYDITDGDCVGDIEEVSHEELDGKQMADALCSVGSEPGFFMLDEDGNDAQEG